MCIRDSSDNDANNYPGNTEVCDGLDNNCNGQIDEGASTTYYADSDGDGFGDISNSMVACTAPSGYVNNNADCDDNDANNYPGNTEVCDGQDNDCDGIIDEGCGTCDDAYLVINTITQSTYMAEINIESDATINSAVPILFSAGSSIDLEPGFEVILGSDFEAIIAPCTPVTSDPVSESGQGHFDIPGLSDIAEDATIEFSITDKDNNILEELSLTKSSLMEFIHKFSESTDSGNYQLFLKVGDSEIKQKLLIVK